MKFISWNVNGIRACIKKGFEDVIQESKADYFCIQETKAQEEQVEWSNPLAMSKYSSTWSSAEKKGYSGTAIFTKDPICELSNKTKLRAYDQEGRGTIAFHKKFTLINLYFPNGSASDDRHNFKMGFLDKILKYFKKMEKEYGPLIICGDYNIAHTEIDIHDPKRNQDTSGFLPEERAWMDKLSQSGFSDSYRLLNPGKVDMYSWWSYRAGSRQRNKGWRLDYFFVSDSLKKKVKSAKIHTEIMGSDHCPVELELDI